MTALSNLRDMLMIIESSLTSAREGSRSPRDLVGPNEADALADELAAAFHHLPPDRLAALRLRVCRAALAEIDALLGAPARQA